MVSGVKHTLLKDGKTRASACMADFLQLAVLIQKSNKTLLSDRNLCKNVLRNDASTEGNTFFSQDHFSNLLLQKKRLSRTVLVS